MSLNTAVNVTQKGTENAQVCATRANDTARTLHDVSLEIQNITTKLGTLTIASNDQHIASMAIRNSAVRFTDSSTSLGTSIAATFSNFKILEHSAGQQQATVGHVLEIIEQVIAIASEDRRTRQDAEKPMFALHAETKKLRQLLSSFILTDH